MMLKICGITNQEDASAAVAAGATALGFNFYPKSPRYIAPERAAAIDTGGAQRVGVFVNESRELMEEVARIALLDVAQLHGDEVVDQYPAGITIWKAAHVTPDFEIAEYDDCPAEALLLDGDAGELYGGAGKTFDWRRAAGSHKRIIIAGGLDASNVARAIELAHPWGVDVSSRIESAPGKKDHRKMKEFLQTAREAFSR